MQVTVIDTDQLGIQGHCPVQLFFGMDFHQHIAASALGSMIQLIHLGIGQRRSNQQHRIRAHGPGLENLPRVDHEILAQHWKVHRVAGSTQVMLITLKEILVGKHRQAGCAVGFVATGNRHRVEIITDHPLAGGSLLDFGNHRRLVVSHPGEQAGDKPTRLSLVLCQGLQITEGVIVLADGNLFLLAGDNLVENSACAHNLAPYADSSPTLRAVLN